MMGMPGFTADAASSQPRGFYRLRGMLTDPELEQDAVVPSLYMLRCAQGLTGLECELGVGGGGVAFGGGGGASLGGVDFMDCVAACQSIAEVCVGMPPPYSAICWAAYASCRAACYAAELFP
jgi:hypothetical protein